MPPSEPQSSASQPKAAVDACMTMMLAGVASSEQACPGWPAAFEGSPTGRRHTQPSLPVAIAPLPWGSPLHPWHWTGSPGHPLCHSLTPPPAALHARPLVGLLGGSTGLDAGLGGPAGPPRPRRAASCGVGTRQPGRPGSYGAAGCGRHPPGMGPAARLPGCGPALAPDITTLLTRRELAARQCWHGERVAGAPRWRGGRRVRPTTSECWLAVSAAPPWKLGPPQPALLGQPHAREYAADQFERWGF